MYESDGSVMVYWHALDSGDASPGTCRTEWGGGRECLVGPAEVLFLIVFPFHTQYRLCLPEELLPVAASSVWVRGPKSGHWGMLRHKGVGFGRDDAEGLREFLKVRGKCGSEGGSYRDCGKPWQASEGQDRIE